MNAFSMSVLMICVNAGIYLVETFGMFGTLGDASSIFPQLTVFSEPFVTLPAALPIVGGLSISGIDAFAVGLAVSTIVVLSSNVITDKGVAYIAFTAIFWGSFFISSTVISTFELPGIEVWYTIFFLLSVLIFAVGLIQMPVGGFKSHQ